MTKKQLEVIATAMRTSRPWRDDAEYMHYKRLNDASWYMFLQWELTLNQIADGLLMASKYKLERNAFMRSAGAYKYTCQSCFHENTVSETAKCGNCPRA